MSLDNDIDKFRKIVDAALKRTDIDTHPRNIRAGFYFHQLRQYYDLFPSDNIKIYLFEEFANNPREVLADLLDHIGLNGDFVFNVDNKFNPSGKPKLSSLAKFIRNDNFFKKGFQNTIPDRWFQFLRVKYQAWMYKKAEPLSIDLRRSILSLYSFDILNLEGLIKRDLSHWQDVI